MEYHDWQGLPGLSEYEMVRSYASWVCAKCGATIGGNETACKPMPDTLVGTDQIPQLKHLPTVLDSDGDPVPMLSCDEVQVCIVMMS
jgi:hypothetical protein